MTKLFSIFILICISPLFAIVALIIILDDGFPVLFKQKRIGKNNSHFWIYKFRTMKKDTPDIPTHLVNDPSVLFTISGPFLRKFSFDELPQLFNIIKGEMTIIGPRPALFNQEDLKKMRTECGVHKLLPGITGWAQVNGRDELSIPKKVSLDEYYLKNRSILLDMKILYLTLLKVIKSEGVST